MKIQELLENTYMSPALRSIRDADSMPECWTSMTLDEMIDLVGETKKQQRHGFAPKPDMPDTVVDVGPEFQKPSTDTCRSPIDTMIGSGPRLRPLFP